MSLASIDGAITPIAEATVPVTDEGLLRGDGAFEVARLYAGVPYAMEDHYARLGRTCEGLRLPADLDALRAEVDALLAAAGPLEALLRIVLTRGGRRIALIEPLPHRARSPA
jgi:branched-chain amino acid aminotransferase